MYRLKNNPYAGMFLISAGALAIFLTTTNPASVSVGVLVVPIILFFLMMFSLAHAAIYRLDLWKGNLGKKRTAALAAASFITVIVTLQSSGGISGADAILLVMIFLLTSVYINRF